jgi:hypothetical protein
MNALDEHAILKGSPPPDRWCRAKTPPIGEWVLQDPHPSHLGWHIRCPSCLEGRVALDPELEDKFGYRLAPEPCTAGCRPELIQWWHLWRLGELPPAPEPEERARRYALAVARGAIRDLAHVPPGRDQARALTRAAYRIGQAEAAGELDRASIARALVRAGVMLGLSAEVAASAARKGVGAGAAAPLKVPT